MYFCHVTVLMRETMYLSAVGLSHQMDLNNCNEANMKSYVVLRWNVSKAPYQWHLQLFLLNSFRILQMFLMLSFFQKIKEIIEHMYRFINMI